MHVIEPSDTTHMAFSCASTRFGHVITNADGKEIPVRLIGEQHLLEDFGRIPTVNDWLNEMPVKSWMLKAAKLSEQ